MSKRIPCPFCRGRFRHCDYGDVPCAECYGTGQWFECSVCGESYDTYYGAEGCELSHSADDEGARNETR